MASPRKLVSNQIRATRKNGPVAVRKQVKTDFEREWDATHGKEVVGGLTLKDMPGADIENKKLNWFLFRRGKLPIDEQGGNRWTHWGRQRRRMKTPVTADAGEDEP